MLAHVGAAPQYPFWRQPLSARCPHSRHPLPPSCRVLLSGLAWVMTWKTSGARAHPLALVVKCKRAEGGTADRWRPSPLDLWAAPRRPFSPHLRHVDRRLEQRAAALRCCPCRPDCTPKPWRACSASPMNFAQLRTHASDLACRRVPSQPQSPSPPLPARCCSAVCAAAVVRCGGYQALQASRAASLGLDIQALAAPPTSAAAGRPWPPTPCPPLRLPSPTTLCRVIPRSKLESAAKHGVGLAYACFWLPAWGDCCLDDPACVPVGEMRLVPDITGQEGGT